LLAGRLETERRAGGYLDDVSGCELVTAVWNSWCARIYVVSIRCQSNRDAAGLDDEDGPLVSGERAARGALENDALEIQRPRR
jgi:hypothetical protein